MAAQQSEQASDVLPLVQLVRDCVERSGLSLIGFARERGVAYSTLRHYHDKNLRTLAQPPRRQTLKELAHALDVRLSVVERAADDSVGRVYREQTPDGATVLLASLEDMPEQERAAEARRLIDLLQEYAGPEGHDPVS